MFFKQGDCAGYYDIVEKVGEGGMGVVYKVRHRILGSTHALKLLRPDWLLSLTEDTRKDVLERFLREGRIQARLRHPNVVPVTDLVSENREGTLIAGLVMDWLDGEDLEVYLQGHGALPPKEATRIIQQCLDALSLIHGAGVIHRDIKPANIFLERSGNVRLMDFGIAHEHNSSLTRTRMRAGSIGYMSPEQARSLGQVDRRTDIFSLGCVLYELLSGQQAFAGESEFDIGVKLIQGQYLPLDDLTPELPAELVAVVHRAMSVEPDERFPDTVQFSSALSEALRAPIKRQQESLRALAAAKNVPLPPGWPPESLSMADTSAEWVESTARSIQTAAIATSLQARNTALETQVASVQGQLTARTWRTGLSTIIIAVLSVLFGVGLGRLSGPSVTVGSPDLSNVPSPYQPSVDELNLSGVAIGNVHQGTAPSEEVLGATQGRLRVISDRKSRVYINGERKGTTPIESIILEAGVYDVRLVALSTGRAKHVQARVDAGKVIQIELNYQ